MMTINLNVPKGWHELTQKQLRYLLFLLSEEYTATAMRHGLDNMEAREECMDIMRELFRQFISVLIQEKTKIAQKNIYLDPRISFQEIDCYFFTGCACAYFQIATDTYTNLCYDKGEWDKDILNDGCFSEVFTSQFK